MNHFDREATWKWAIKTRVMFTNPYMNHNWHRTALYKLNA